VRIPLAIAVAASLTVVAAAQDTADKKPNIAITGCLMSQGYATFIVDNARIDATGDKAASAVAGAATGARPSGEPAKWQLEEPGNIRTHVGEKVQVLGVTDWKMGDPVPTEGSGPPAPTPHITVTTVKFIAPNCS
jgi:hypothetical protein